MCLDSSMVSLRKFIRKNNFKDKVIVLTSYTREGDVVLFHRLHQIDVYSIIENEITLPIKMKRNHICLFWIPL
ncbi:hypothetical protein GCM10022395_09500 [Snuella lapsa]|uniref:Uncharacterized protein n=1 Tax=Snuella lapsa TaxID=870481 RepID=A0ABP6X4M0_9FLAO